jgi:hypothetical protein
MGSRSHLEILVIDLVLDVIDSLLDVIDLLLDVIDLVLDVIDFLLELEIINVIIAITIAAIKSIKSIIINILILGPIILFKDGKVIYY